MEAVRSMPRLTTMLRSRNMVGIDLDPGLGSRLDPVDHRYMRPRQMKYSRNGWRMASPLSGGTRESLLESLVAVP